MSKDSLNCVRFRAAACRHYFILPISQSHCSSQYVHATTIIVDIVSQGYIWEDFSVLVYFLYCKDHCMSKFKFSEIQTEIALIKINILQILNRTCENTLCTSIHNLKKSNFRQIFNLAVLYVLLAWPRCWCSLKGFDGTILPSKKGKDSPDDEVPVLD